MPQTAILICNVTLKFIAVREYDIPRALKRKPIPSEQKGIKDGFS
jgi:hypothetical protein